METKDQKLCRDCKHFVQASPLAMLTMSPSMQTIGCCSPERPITVELYVYGRSKIADPKDARMSAGFCGESGRSWEEKPPQPELPIVMKVEEYNSLGEKYEPPNPWWKFWKQEG